MNVLKLLHSKNRCLEKFLGCSQEFIFLAEQGDFSHLDKFHNRREVLMKAFVLYDQKISKTIQTLLPIEKTTELIQSARQAEEIKCNLIQAISKVDQKIMLAIQKEQRRLQKELLASEKESQIVKKFKSSWVSESGETLDGKL